MFKMIIGSVVIFVLGFTAAWQLRNKNLTISFINQKEFRYFDKKLVINGTFKALNFPQPYRLHYVDITCKDETGECVMDNVILFDNGYLYTDKNVYAIDSIDQNIIIAKKWHNECEEQHLEINTKSSTVLHKSIGIAFTGTCQGQHQLHISELMTFYPEAQLWSDR